MKRRNFLKFLLAIPFVKGLIETNEIWPVPDSKEMYFVSSQKTHLNRDGTFEYPFETIAEGIEKKGTGNTVFVLLPTIISQ